MSNQSERHAIVPFPVLFMRVFHDEDDARELLEIITKFLIADDYDILRAQVIESEHGFDKKRFTLSVAHAGKTFGMTQLTHDGFCFVYHSDAYSTEVKEKPDATSIHGEYFTSERWRVRVPLRLTAVDIFVQVGEQEVA